MLYLYDNNGVHGFLQTHYQRRPSQSAGELVFSYKIIRNAYKRTQVVKFGLPTDR